MSKFPSAYDVYNLSENFMATIEDTFRGTGDDNSLTNSKIIHIGSAPTERMIAFTAFVESYKINLQKQVKEYSEETSTTTYFTDINGNLSISLSLNLPAHSTNEAVNNVAKIEELQRLIKTGHWGSPGTFSSLTGTNTPIMIVHFVNLISNGRSTKSFAINSFTDLLQKGFPCYIESVVYEPQTDSGFFEFDNFLYPKNIKLSLELKYESKKLINKEDANRNKMAISSFELTSKFKEVNIIPTGEETTTPIIHRMDDGLFPFHSDGIRGYNNSLSKMSVKKMNDLDLENFGKNNKHFLYIGMGLLTNADMIEAVKNAGTNKDFLSNEVFLKYVMFESAITSFSRGINFKTEASSDADTTTESSIHNILKSSKFKSLEYPLNIQVISSSLREAYQNCAKIQYLMRLFLKKSYNFSDIKKNNSSQTSIASKVMVYMPSFIESGRGGKSVSTDLKTINETKSVQLNFTDLQVEVDMSSGFYEDRGRLLPKKMTVNMTFKTGNPEFILGYNFNDNKWKPQWTLASPPPPHGVYNNGEQFLFPYNRKTVKIGGK
jgi:hypothetical protein